ncbi:MAG: 16S rRNA (adenine(1518)-N(6)/adenine(1519)-N(6))-dimethyltransferase RsmA [Dehalococcoidales bacterium]|nr:16S rRNA (adenine(1518)-N(6)/adenine(1519)-N(6))-dimethyltransferase RsmA [Dehalococcoidales bacterium]
MHDLARGFMVDEGRSGPSLIRRTKDILHRYGIRAKKGLGQHFLVDGRVLNTILEAAELAPTDTVIEVGPGLGILTEELARRAGWVIAIELDSRLSGILREMFPRDNVVIVNEDVLGVSPAELLTGSPPRFPAGFGAYKVVANLPYYITSPVLRHFLEAGIRPSLMVVMVQKEVARQITAKPGQCSLLSIAVQFYGRPSIVRTVPARSFYPAPEVDSAVLKIEVYDRPRVEVGDTVGFFRFVKAGFCAARKQIINSLSQGLGMRRDEVFDILVGSGIDPKRRAETLTMEEWADLWKTYRKAVGDLA